MDTVLDIGLNDQTAESWLALNRANGRFIFDSYRRLIQGFGSIVLGIASDKFESQLKSYKQKAGYHSDPEMTESDWREIVTRFKSITINECKQLAAAAAKTGRVFGAGTAACGITEFPQDVRVQLRCSIGAVFDSWNSERAVAYRNKTGISHTFGTACSIQAMVFGNSHPKESATGVAFTRNPSTGENQLYGDFLENAQGEDVVSGIRNTRKISELGACFPAANKRFLECCQILEKAFKNMQDVEFTIESNELFMLQCRNGKRTARAQAVIASDMVREGLITKAEAVKRLSPDDITTLLLPQLDRKEIEAAISAGRRLTRAVNASPGGAVGQIVFSAEAARSAKASGKSVILVRPFTKPEDVVGFFSSVGVLTAEGGATSHAAVVARQFGVPCVVGASALEIDLENRKLYCKSNTDSKDSKDSKQQTKQSRVELNEFDWISLDATCGDVYSGQIKRVAADFQKETELNV